MCSLSWEWVGIKYGTMTKIGKQTELVLALKSLKLCLHYTISVITWRKGNLVMIYSVLRTTERLVWQPSKSGPPRSGSAQAALPLFMLEHFFTKPFPCLLAEASVVCCMRLDRSTVKVSHPFIVTRNTFKCLQWADNVGH